MNLWAEAPTVSYDNAMFGGYWSSASGDIRYLICHVTSQNHVIKGLSNFVSLHLITYVIVSQHPAMFDGHIVLVEI